MPRLFRLLGRKTPLEARVEPEGHILTVTPGQSLLDAALAAGIPWPWRCRVGSCGRCRCRVVSGTIEPTSDFSYTLKPEEIASGAALACQTRLKSPVIVHLDTDPSPPSGG